MKKQYFEAAVLTIFYLVFSWVAIAQFPSENSLMEVVLFPAKFCLAPFIEKDFSLEQLNMSFFGLYFLWSFNCVYLSVIKSTLKQLSWKTLSKL